MPRPRGCATDRSITVASCSEASQPQSACRMWCASCAPLRIPMSSPDAGLSSTPTGDAQFSLSCHTHHRMSEEAAGRTHSQAEETWREAHRFQLQKSQRRPFLAVSSRDNGGKQSWKICCVTCSRHACRPNYRFRLCRTSESFFIEVVSGPTFHWQSWADANGRLHLRAMRHAALACRAF